MGGGSASLVTAINADSDGRGEDTHHLLRMTHAILFPTSEPLYLLSLYPETSLPGFSQICLMLSPLVATQMSFTGRHSPDPSSVPLFLISLFVSIMALITIYKWQVYHFVFLTVVCLLHLTLSSMKLEILSVLITAICPTS